MAKTITAEQQQGAESHQLHVGCGCGIETAACAEDMERKAVAVDPEAKTGNLNRLRRIEGQVRGIQRMVNEDRYCADILMQIASVQEALRSVGRELMRNHLRHCAAAAIRAGSEEEAEAMYNEILDLMYRHGR
jgi:DNA-binding FrmR family transcriptional regulator